MPISEIIDLVSDDEDTSTKDLNNKHQVDEDLEGTSSRGTNPNEAHKGPSVQRHTSLQTSNLAFRLRDAAAPITNTSLQKSSLAFRPHVNQTAAVPTANNPPAPAIPTQRRTAVQVSASRKRKATTQPSAPPKRRTTGALTVPGYVPPPPSTSSESRSSSESPSVLSEPSQSSPNGFLWSIPQYQGPDANIKYTHPAPQPPTSHPTSHPTGTSNPLSSPTTSTPWTTSQINHFAQGLQNSFDFNAFASRHSKTRKQVLDTFEFLVFKPIFKYGSDAADAATSPDGETLATRLEADMKRDREEAEQVREQALGSESGESPNGEDEAGGPD